MNNNCSTSIQREESPFFKKHNFICKLGFDHPVFSTNLMAKSSNIQNSSKNKPKKKRTIQDVEKSKSRFEQFTNRTEPDKTAKDTHFWTRFMRIIRIAHPYPRFASITGSLWLIVLTAGAIAIHTLVTSEYGLIKGNFAKATADTKREDLIHAIWHGILYALLLSLMKSVMFLLQYLIQAQVRSNLMKPR